jgi:hypothetical protein
MTFAEKMVRLSPWKTSITCSAVVLAVCLFLIQLSTNQAIDNNCERISEKAQALVDIGIVLSQDTPIKPEDDPAAIARINLANERKADTRRIIAELSAPDACDDGVLPPSRAGDYELEQ